MTSDTPDSPVLLQPFQWPDPKLNSERDLFVRIHGQGGMSQTEGVVYFWPGTHVQFDTYFNLFNIGKWRNHCGLEDLGLQLRGTGRIEVTIWLSHPDRSWVRMATEVVQLHPTKTQRIAAEIPRPKFEAGVAFFEFRALSRGELNWAAWDTLQQPRRTPELALSVTTFRREEAVRDVVKRFESFVAQSRLGAHIHMIVVDNGRSADIAATDKVTPIGNENFGGAGGFARGLIAAKERGASHCLFMDDDASTPTDAFERTWLFLAYAIDPKTAIAGAMISTRHAWALWENGALFDGACRPLHGGTDLRDPAQVFHVEYDSTPRQPDNFYGGWWYFAFPVDEVKYMPFPFFVRGDDVSFSLAHDFNIVTLPGVVSFQESFTEKDSPTTWYLDLRSHLAHHLSLPSMDIGRRATVRIAAWFWARTLLTFHYETMEAVNMAIEDVLKGPQYFARNADVAARRAQLGRLRKAEVWGDMPEPPPERHRLKPHNLLHRALIKLGAKGYLVPFFKRLGNHVNRSPEQKWDWRMMWGVSQVTFHDPVKRKGYTLRHSKRRAFGTSLRSFRLMLVFWLRYDRLKADWQKAYPELTGRDFWDQTLALTPAEGSAQETPETETKIAASGKAKSKKTAA